MILDVKIAPAIRNFLYDNFINAYEMSMAECYKYENSEVFVFVTSLKLSKVGILCTTPFSVRWKKKNSRSGCYDQADAELEHISEQRCQQALVSNS